MPYKILKYSALIIIGVGVAFLYFFIDPSEVDFLPKCPLYATTGLYCPGCGSQRATHALLNSNIGGILRQNIFYAFALMLIGYHLIISVINFLFKKSIYNYLYHPYTPKIVLLGILLFWILRNIPVYPFNILAPK